MQSESQTIDQPRRSFIEAARRAQIIECAIETIAEVGFAQASLAQIAKRAGISAGVISYHFAGKDDLIREVGAHVYETGRAFITPLVSAEDTPEGALRAFITASVAFIVVRPKFTIAIMNIIRAGRDERGAPRIDPGVGEPRRAGFLEVIEWGQRTGAFRAFAPRVMMMTIVEALDAIPQQLADDPNLDLPAYGEELATLFALATRNASPHPTGSLS